MTTPAPLAADPLALAQALIRCRSVTPAEGGALTLLQSVLAPAGFECHRMTFSEAGTPDVENLYARFGSIGRNGPHLCFAGHTDVVPPGDETAWTHPPFDAVVKDGVLWGRGAIDMKGAIACFAVAALDYIQSKGGNIPGAISFLITGDEEGPSINGTVKVLDWMKARGERMDACVVGEPSSLERLGDELKIGRRGSLNGELVVHGKQGHAAYPRSADNPVPKLARMIDRLCATPLDNGTTHFEPSSLEVTVISVNNTATNVIPSEARAKLNIRYNDMWTRPKVEAHVRAICEAVAAETTPGGKTFRWELTFSGTGDVFRTEPGPLVETMSGAVAAVTGLTPRMSTGGGTSDARFIHFHCPVIEFGLLNKTIHQVDERCAVDDLVRLTKVYREFIGRYFGS
jgi:succinyl-diaminopimelate desuccinylase